MEFKEVTELLEARVRKYNQPSFIEYDPVSIPHLFTRKEDIEISGWLTAILSWGQRKTIVAKGKELAKRMDHSPFEFIMKAGPQELSSFDTFIHRTFNGDDCLFMLNALREIYLHHGGLERCFSPGAGNMPSQRVREAIIRTRKIFLSYPHLPRSEKHLSDPARGSASKRVNMFLRWMVRDDHHGVDFGLWKDLKPSMLMCPLDVHSGAVARKLGLLRRAQNDWKAVEELTAALLRIDPQDPVRFDYALFGMGVFERFQSK